MATAAAIAITFPGGREWVAKPKMSALISVRLGSYHTAAAACHPPHPLIHIETWEYYVHSHTNTLSHPHFSSCVSSPPSSIIHFYSIELHLCTDTYSIFFMGRTRSHAHFYSLRLTVFLLLLLHTFTLCLCQFYLSRSVMQVLHCSFLPHCWKTIFPNEVYFFYSAASLFFH